MRRTLVLLLIALSPLIVKAQDNKLVFKGFTPSSVSDVRARTSAIYDNNQKLTALIEIILPEEGASFEGIVGLPQYRSNNWFVHVAENTPSITIFVPGCKSFKYVFPKKIPPQSGCVYQLSLSKITRLRTLVMPIYSANQTVSSYGLMLALCRTNGAYIKAKIYSRHEENVTYETTADGRQLISFSRNTTDGKERAAGTIGYMLRAVDISEVSALYLYGGGGYGYYKLRRYLEDDNQNQPISTTFSAAELDLGLIFRWKTLAVSIGAQAQSVDFVEANIGLGIMF